ncbi:MAG: TM2 domain-containing protein [Burkholderiales bacterium]|uniref:TM2 domain-containing protein n=1 Tax=Nitrosomonas sp. TaxID=42353 RepID=UPI001E117F33|nr:TM2 domain-containing protein [Nitrosomonas sp.]MCB1948062.1 TM2 domain-containing protein [Nitrosomonas sp.]MCP5242336.1 TM2 domain-containing protein [Burkholderiales bacterium]
MLSEQEVLDEEERLRKCVRTLPDDKRLAFHKQAEKQLKDPDTYATLNYIFIAGLHHFYLGKWIRGLLNICIFLAGVVLLFTPLAILGILLIVFISIIELYALFRSQIIVQAHNNLLMDKIYREIVKNKNTR